MWIYKGKEIYNHDDLLPNCTDFVYIICYASGHYYIGKKTIRSIRRKPPLKGKKRNRRILTNHPFKDYIGSHESGVGLQITSKEILYQCSDKKAATYLETGLLFHYDAIFDPTYLNECIGGTFYENSLDGLMEE